MPDEYTSEGSGSAASHTGGPGTFDPSGNTAQFRAFVSEPEPAPNPGRRMAILVTGGVLAIVAIALAVWALS
jgi:hypothetical protein